MNNSGINMDGNLSTGLPDSGFAMSGDVNAVSIGVAVVMSFLVTSSNLFVLVIFLCKSELRQNSKIDFIVWLCFSDIVVGISGWLFVCNYLIKDLRTNAAYCRLMYYFIIAGIGQSLSHTCLICIERYMAVVSSTMYRDLRHKYRYTIIFLTCLFVHTYTCILITSFHYSDSITYCSLKYYPDTNAVFPGISCLYIPLLILIPGLYIALIIKVRQLGRKTHPLSRPSVLSTENNPCQGHMISSRLPPTQIVDSSTDYVARMNCTHTHSMASITDEVVRVHLRPGERVTRPTHQVSQFNLPPTENVGSSSDKVAHLNILPTQTVDRSTHQVAHLNPPPNKCMGSSTHQVARLNIPPIENVESDTHQVSRLNIPPIENVESDTHQVSRLNIPHIENVESDTHQVSRLNIPHIENVESSTHQVSHLNLRPIENVESSTQQAVRLNASPTQITDKSTDQATCVNIIHVAPPFSTAMNSPPLHHNHTSSQAVPRLVLEKQLVVTIGILVVVLLLLTGPLLLIMFLEGCELIDISRTTRISISFLTYLNSALNPVLYIWRIRTFREQLKRMACC